MKAAKGLGLSGSGCGWWGWRRAAQGVGTSILQSWADRLDLCRLWYLCKGGKCFILVSANQKVLETVRDVSDLRLGLLTVSLRAGNICP